MAAGCRCLQGSEGVVGAPEGAISEIRSAGPWSGQRGRGQVSGAVVSTGTGRGAHGHRGRAWAQGKLVGECRLPRVPAPCPQPPPRPHPPPTAPRPQLPGCPLTLPRPGAATSRTPLGGSTHRAGARPRLRWPKGPSSFPGFSNLPLGRTDPAPPSLRSEVSSQTQPPHTVCSELLPASGPARGSAGPAPGQRGSSRLSCSHVRVPVRAHVCAHVCVSCARAGVSMSPSCGRKQGQRHP